MEDMYKVVFTGELQDGLSIEIVAKRLVAITNLDPEKAKNLLSGGKPALIRKNLEKQVALKYREKFTQAGMIIEILPQSAAAVPPPIKAEKKVAPPVQPKPAPLPPAEPSPRAEREENQRQQNTTAENVYSAPKAELRSSTVVSSDDWLGEPRQVPASRGWGWLTGALPLFLGSPVKWLVMSVIAMGISSLANMIPILGPFVYQFLLVLFIGGLFMAAHEQANQREYSLTIVFRGFSQNRNQLIMISVIYFGFFFGLFFLLGLFIGGMVGFSDLTSFNPDTLINKVFTSGTVISLLMALGALVTIPIIMAYWFTTPLVALMDLNAWAAYKLSLKACARNWRAFLLYSIVLLILGGIALALFSGLIGAIVAILADSLVIMVPVIIGVSLLLIGPILVIGGLSHYVAFRDIFHT